MLDFDIQEMYDRMPFRDKLNLFLRTNHYIVWKITLMDVTIILPTFILLGYALGRCTQWPVGRTMLVCIVVCGLIEYFRIRYRRVKTWQLVTKKAEYAESLLHQYAALIEKSGTEEDRKMLQDLSDRMKEARELADKMSDIVYQEDILGLKDREHD